MTNKKIPDLDPLTANEITDGDKLVTYDASSGATKFLLKSELFDALFKDEDDMSSDSAVFGTTQQAAKAYIDGLQQRFHLQYTTSSGTGGGSLTASTWNKASLTSVFNNITDASVSSGVVTLPAGTYAVSGWSGVGSGFGGAEYTCKSRLRNTTDSSTAIVGASGRASGYASARLIESFELDVMGVVTITDSKDFELQSWCNQSGLYFGYAVSSGEDELYADLMIQKIA